MEFNLGEELNSQRKEARMTDVTLVCEDKNIPAHKAALCAASNYFRELFSAEINNDNVQLQNITAKQMDIVLSFIYTGKFEVEDQNLEALLAASCFLQINRLIECCFNRLFKTLNCDNFLHISNLVSQYYEEGMDMHVVPFLLRHFEEIANREQFLHLTAYEVRMICQHINIFKCSMDVVVEALFKWAEAGEDRENTFLEMLPLINLRRLSTELLLKSLKRALVRKNSHSLMLMSAEVTVRTSRLALKNIETKKPMLLTFGCNEEKRHMLRMYDVKKNQWLPSQTLPFRLERRMCMVWFNGHVYVFGGKENCTEENEENKNFITSTTVIKYCPANNTITAFGDLKVGVCYANAGVLGEYIYVVNGLNEQIDGARTVQRYDPASGTCEMMASTANSQLFPFVLACSNNLLVLGSSTVDIYDPNVGKWNTTDEIPAVISCSRVAIHEKRLFVLPKHLASEFDIYDLTSGKWQTKQFDRCPLVMSEIYSTMFERKCILLVRDDKNVLHSFDPELEVWIRESTPNDKPWNYYQTCVAHM